MPKVYFLADAQKPKFVKIGVAVDPQRRLFELQTGNPHTLEIKATTNGGYHLESALHRAFKDEWHKGEWYVLTPRLAAVINELQQVPVDPISEEDARELSNELGADIREFGVRIERRVEKYIARHDKHDGNGVPALQVKDRFNLTYDDLHKFMCWLRVYACRTNQGEPVGNKPWGLKYTIFFDGGESDVEHGRDTKCKCPTCINMSFGVVPPDCWPFKEDCWPPEEPIGG